MSSSSSCFFLSSHVLSFRASFCLLLVFPCISSISMQRLMMETMNHSVFVSSGIFLFVFTLWSSSHTHCLSFHWNLLSSSSSSSCSFITNLVMHPTTAFDTHTTRTTGTGRHGMEICSDQTVDVIL